MHAAVDVVKRKKKSHSEEICIKYDVKQWFQTAKVLLQLEVYINSHVVGFRKIVIFIIQNLLILGGRFEPHGSNSTLESDDRFTPSDASSDVPIKAVVFEN